MKNITKILGIIAFTAVIVFVMAVCSEEVEDQRPKLSDYDIVGDFLQTDKNNVKPITITPKPGKSSGAITIYYEKSTLPAEYGEYEVTFDVAAASGWTAMRGFLAGTLIIGDGAANSATELQVNQSIAKIPPILSSCPLCWWTLKQRLMPQQVNMYTLSFT